MNLTDYISAPILSSAILVMALALFVSERVRHDLVALIALMACVLTGLVSTDEALRGFADPAVIAVASVLVVGRALEMTGVASKLARVIIPPKAPFSLQLMLLMGGGALLSAFMNNIAALVITMPLAAEIARQNKRPVGATLMPLSFATILGGMTTLIGTPANMILSSVREERLGQGFGFFTMAPVGVIVTVMGVVYLGLIGWRLLPVRKGAGRASDTPWRVLELQLTENLNRTRRDIVAELRSTTSRLLAFIRRERILDWPSDNKLKRLDKLLLLSRSGRSVIEDSVSFKVAPVLNDPSHVTARMVVAHGSPLIGEWHEVVRQKSGGELRVTAVGPKAASMRKPLSEIVIQTGDQLYITGPSEVIAAFGARERLLEIDRNDPVPVNLRTAAWTVGIFVTAILAIVFGDVPPSISFLAAAIVIAGARLIPARETYKSIDWSIIVLLAAMIPVGGSFQASGAANIVAETIGGVLTGLPLAGCLAAVCGLTLLLSILLNNVATAVIMGPLAIQLAGILGVSPDAMLLAVLVGTSSDFLTPIGHQNNLLVMGPGGYKFTDYIRMGFILSLIVISTSAFVLSAIYS